jgi:hypothetical protein
MDTHWLNWPLIWSKQSQRELLTDGLLSRLSLSRCMTSREHSLSRCWLSICRFGEMADGVVLRQNVADQHKWELMQHGSYSSKSAYEALFLGSIRFGPWRKIWKTWAPACCKFFIWLVFHGRVWTANRLAKRNLTHPEACPLCDQAAADPEIDKKGAELCIGETKYDPTM